MKALIGIAGYRGEDRDFVANIIARHSRYDCYQRRFSRAIHVCLSDLLKIKLDGGVRYGDFKNTIVGFSESQLDTYIHTYQMTLRNVVDEIIYGMNKHHTRFWTKPIFYSPMPEDSVLVIDDVTNEEHAEEILIRGGHLIIVKRKDDDHVFGWEDSLSRYLSKNNVIVGNNKTDIRNKVVNFVTNIDIQQDGKKKEQFYEG